MTDSVHDGEFRMLMPFVVCEDQGGPYKADAFAGGYTASRLDETLRTLAFLKSNGLTLATVQAYVPPALVPQLDLIAMRHGFTLYHEPWDEHPEDWTLATFALISPDE